MINLVIAWTCVGVFIATAILTLLALTKVIELAHRKYLDRLFAILIVEIVTIGVGVFAGYVQGPATLEAEVRGAGKREVAKQLSPDIEAIYRASARSPQEAELSRATARMKTVIDGILADADSE